ncbi:MAG: hypothetical protein ACPG9H_02165, partial [Candidatus Puniceispirillaceae bacterium]
QTEKQECVSSWKTKCMNITLVVSLKSYRILATASYTLLDLSDEIRHSVVVNYGILSKLDERFIRMAQRS